MLSILPAFSSPELKAFPLHLRHYRSCGSAPSLPNLPRAGRCLACFPPSCQQPLSRQLTSRRSQDRRDCVIYSAPHTLLSIKSHRLAKARIKVVAFVVLSQRMCQSRKDPYLPLEPQCVRLLPRPTGLPPMAFVADFRLCSRRRENRPQTP